jgi:hypothetical protein
MNLMGVIDFIKGLFSAEQEPAEEVSLENIDEWFNKRHSSKQDFLKGQIEGINARVAQEISSTRQNIENIRNAQLRNQKIPEKAKHFMEGNRSAYMQKTGQFLESLKLPDDISLISDFLADFDNRLEGFGKSTARSYTILTEFFGEEAARIAGNVKNIDKLISEVKEAVKNSKLKEMDEIKHSIAKLKNRVNHKAFLEQETAKKESQAGELEKEKAKIEKSIGDMENSKEYKDCQLLKHRLKEIKKESSEKESEINHKFVSLERPMKKYLRVIYSDRDMLEKYIQSPIRALTQDFGLKIVAILGNMKKAILDNTIELKDKQKIKAVEEIKKLDKDFLSKFLSEYAQIKKKENGISKEVGSLTIIDDLEKAKESLKIKSAMLEKAKKDLESLNSELGKIDIEMLRKALSEKIKSVTDVSVIIS